MNCPFCDSANSRTSGACQVCGGPLRAAQPKSPPQRPDNRAPIGASPATKPSPAAPLPATPATVSLAMPAANPALSARHELDASALLTIAVGFASGETPMLCLVRADGIVQRWDAQADELSSFSVGRWLRKSSPLCCALVTAGFVATGAENGAVRWHDWHGRERKSPAPHLGRVLALAASDTHFYSGGSDGVIWATPLAGKRDSRAIIEGLGALTTLAVAPDATLLAIGRDDGTIQLWRVNAENAAAKLDWTRTQGAAPIQSLGFSPNGQMLVSRDAQNSLALWAAQTSYQLPLAPQSSRVMPAFAADSRILAVADARGGVALHDVALGTLLHDLPGCAPVESLAFAPDATRLAVASAGEIAVWEMG